MIYLVAWADGLNGFDTHEAIDRAFLTRAEAEAEVGRVAEAIERHRATGSSGVYDRGLTIIELPLGGHVTVGDHLYLAKYLKETP